MTTLTRAADRGHTQLEWLDSRHSFSFGGFQDPERMGFRSLRVLNDDRVAPGGGFATHGHRDMEILTWVLEGTLAHRDSMGNVQNIASGELQRMTAGTGVTHSEFNPSDETPVHFLQIWLLPERLGLEPDYQQAPFDSSASPGELLLIASGSGREDSLKVNQDVELHAATLIREQGVELELKAGRHAFLHVARGAVRVAGEELEEGAGLAISETSTIRVEGVAGESEVLLFDLA